MGIADWERISKVRLDDLSSMSTEDIDIIYELMSNIDDINKVEEVDKLQQAFSVSQFIMSYKAEESKSISEELEDANVEIRKLKVIKEELEKENAALQRSDGADINVVRETRHWEMERESMIQEIQELKSKYNSLTQEDEAKEERLVKQHKELESLKEANSKLNENVEFLRQRTTQLRNQKDSSQDTNKSELAYIRSELRQKKIDLDNAHEKAAHLHEQIDELTASLEAATDEIERLTRDYRQMKTSCGATDGELQAAEAENKMLRAQMEELREQMGDKVDMDDRVMAHVNEQVQKWKQIMDERDSEICRLYEESARLRQDLHKSGLGGEKASVQALIKLVKEREHDVAELTRQLVDATGAIEENTELIANLKKDLDRSGGGSAGHQMRRIKELRQMLDDKERRLKDTVARLEQVEGQTADKEQELNEALERNKMYEKGEFGLSEAVGEIKAVKAQLAVKERQLEQMCQELNKVGYSLEEMRFENGHLRTKLGIPVTEELDIEGYKRQKAAQDEEERAINIVLQKEIEKLEDERLVMKKKIRVLARQAGLRAGSAGLEAGDVMDEFRTLDLEDALQRSDGDRTGTRAFSTRRNESGTVSHTWKLREKEMSRELFQAVKDVEKRENDVAQLSARNSQLQGEHDAMRDALRHLRDEWQQISSSSSTTGTAGKGATVIECPVLDKLLVALETRKLIGDFDSGLYLKARLDNLEGRNEELRLELRNSRVETQKLQLDCDRMRQRLRIMEPSFDDLDDGGDGTSGTGLLAGLPEPLSSTAAQTIAALNQHLIFVLQEKALKEQALDKMDLALDNYRRKFALVRHQQGLLYRQYADEKQKYESEIEALRARLRDMEGSKSEDAARIAEFNRLLDSLGHDDNALKQRLAELTRDVTVLKVNESALTRRYGTVQEMEQALRRETNKLKNEMIQIEAVVTDRMGYYRRFKETANYKLNVLQKDLDESVPKKDLDKLQIKFDELTEKYRNFLEKQNILIGRGQSIQQIENELTKMKMDHEALKKILEAEKQRRHVLEATLEEIGEESVSHVSHRSNTSPRKIKSSMNEAHLISISKKVTTLEMKEINERERADHAARMYENIKSTWNEAEKRNKELEEKLSQLTHANLDLQKIERELRDELVDSVSKEINDHEKSKVLELEKREMAAKHEIEKLKEIAEIATMQANTLQQQQVSREKELGSLRQQLLDIQCQSDDKTTIGKLHRHIVQLQMSETSALRKLDDIQRVQKRLEAQLLKIEQTCDDKDQNLYHTRLEARSRAKHLKDTINSLRERFSGCVPLARQERFTSTLIRLTEEKVKLDKELQKTICAKFDLETQLESVKIVRENEKELKEATGNKKREKNVLESWSAKMEQIRLDSLKQKRQTDLLRHEVEHLESVIKCQESQLSQVDEDLVRIGKTHDEKELSWEQRENELERIILNLENIQGEVIIAAHSFQEATGRKEYFGTMPDASAPLPNQLEQAVATIKKNIRIIFDKENENKSLKKQSKDQEGKIRELEGALLKRERYINEMRLRLPATEERDEQMKKISEATSATLLGQDNIHGGVASSNYADEKTMWAAQKTLASLQERLRAKDESVQRYEKLLKEARDDLVASNQRHAEEMELVRDRVQPQTSRRLELAAQALPMENRLTSEQLRENNELRDLLVIETRQSEDLRFQLGELQRLLAADRLKAETNEKIFQSRLKEADVRIENDLLDLKENINNLKNKLGVKENQIEFQNAEIAKLKADASRSPSAEMKNSFNRLNEQLKEKEKQLNILRKNLAEVKKTVADQSIDALRITRDEMVKQENVQKMLDKHTRDLSNELEANRDQVLQYQRELRASRADRDRLQIELDGMKADFEHKDGLFKKFKADKNKLEQENEELRGQLQRIKNLRNLSSNDALKQELEATKMKLHLIEEDNINLKRAVTTSEKPQFNAGKSSHPDGGKLAAWEEGKKSQKMQDKMREKLADKENEVSNLGRQLDTTTRALDRLRREKQVLEGRLTDKWGPGALLDVDEDVEKIISSTQAKKNFAIGSSSPSLDGVDELKRKNMELEREINRLCSRDTGGVSSAVNAVALKEAEMRNRLLQRNIDDLERRVVKSGNATVINLEKERAMQNEIIRLNGENLALKFEVESSRKELPRLKEKLSEQKKYVDLLRAEKDALEARMNAGLESSASTISNIRKVGESGKSTKELEKVIARMKKVVEKTQLENERLKSAPGVVMSEQTALLRAENAELRQELAEVRGQVGQRLADRYDAKERGVVKMAEDYERLRKELGQERAEHERTQGELKQLVRELEKRDKRNADLESKLAIAESRGRLSIGGRGEHSELQEENRRLKLAVAELQSQMTDRRKQSVDLLKADEFKRRYEMANQRNSLLERQLKNFSEQFGVSVDLG